MVSPTDSHCHLAYVPQCLPIASGVVTSTISLRRLTPRAPGTYSGRTTASVHQVRYKTVPTTQTSAVAPPLIVLLILDHPCLPVDSAGAIQRYTCAGLCPGLSLDHGLGHEFGCTFVLFLRFSREEQNALLQIDKCILLSLTTVCPVTVNQEARPLILGSTHERPGGRNPLNPIAKTLPRRMPR